MLNNRVLIKLVLVAFALAALLCGQEADEPPDERVETNIESADNQRPIDVRGLGTDEYLSLISSINDKEYLLEIAGASEISVNEEGSIEQIKSEMYQSVFGEPKERIERDSGDEGKEDDIEEEDDPFKLRTLRPDLHGDIQLKNARIIERYESDYEDLIRVYGEVHIYAYDFDIFANEVILSLDSDEIYGSGNVLIDDGSTRVKGQWFVINRESESGFLFNGTTFMPEEQVFVDGRVIKFKDDRFFLDEGYFTTSLIEPATYYFYADKVYVWDKKKFMAVNMSVNIGQQPFFWFPIYVQNYWGVHSSWHHRFGETLRDGVWLQSIKKFKDSIFGVEHDLSVDLYQKRGIMIGDTMKVPFKYLSGTLDLKTAYARQVYYLDPAWLLPHENRYINFVPEEYDRGKPMFRWKIDASGRSQLFNFRNLKLNLSGNYTLMSDLYFNSDFEVDKDDFDLGKFIEYYTDTPREYVGRRSASGSINNQLKMDLNIFRHKVNAQIKYGYRSLRNLSVDENVSNTYYMPALSSVTLPNLSYSYGGTLLPKVLKLGYGVNVNYNHTKTYKRYSQGVYFTQVSNLSDEEFAEEKEKLEEVLNERHKVKATANLSRSFRIFNFSSINTKGSFEYNLQDSVSDEPEDELLDEKATYKKVGANASWNFSLPQSIFPKRAREYFNFGLNWNNSYAVSYKLAEEYEPHETYGGFQNHKYNTSAGATFTGYGLFFLPGLNMNMRTGSGFNLDLRQKYDHENEEYIPYEEDTDEMRSNRLRWNTLNSSASLSYKSLKLAYNHVYNIEDEKVTRNGYSLSGTMKVPLKDALYRFFPKFYDYVQNEYGGDADFTLNFGGNISHDIEEPTRSRISLSSSFKMKMGKRWNISFSANSVNREPYLYFKKYAEEEGEEQVAFFKDIADSFRFDNEYLRSKALFKMQSLNFHVTRELDGWEMEMDFSISPKSLSSTLAHSVKGYYWQKKVWLEFHLKQFDEFKFPKKEKDFSEDLLDEFLD